MTDQTGLRTSYFYYGSAHFLDIVTIKWLYDRNTYNIVRTSNGNNKRVGVDVSYNPTEDLLTGDSLESTSGRLDELKRYCIAIRLRCLFTLHFKILNWFTLSNTEHTLVH